MKDWFSKLAKKRIKQWRQDKQLKAILDAMDNTAEECFGQKEKK